MGRPSWLTSICLVFVLAWLAIFDMLEEYVGEPYYPGGAEPLSVALIDLAMWIGWLPFALLLGHELGPASLCSGDVAAPNDSLHQKEL